jgi:DNA-binding CsgD family transcriptional regulator
MQVASLARGPRLTSPSAQLLERDAEIEALERAAGRLARGHGGVVVVEAAAGLGKTALVDVIAETANEDGCLVRRAAPGPLEREFALGVIRTLLEAPLRATDGGGRDELIDGPAAAAGALLLGAGIADAGTPALAHSVMWLCARLAAQQSLALLLDDAQWADRASLEVLAYLARRAEELPLLIVVSSRGEHPHAHMDLLGLLAGTRDAIVLHPGPLTPMGAVRLIHRDSPDTPIRVCCRYHEEAGGNPWILVELANRLAEHRPGARTTVRRRLAELEPSGRAVAAALAILGDEAPAHVVCEVAGLPFGGLASAHHELAAAGLGGPDGGLSHSLIATAIAADLPAAEAERLHREAASGLARAGIEACEVGDHLLRCRPQAEGWVSRLLLRAAAQATDEGAPRRAAAYLERALEERAEGDDRARMLCQLATTLFDAGLPDSRRRLLDALRETRDATDRAEVLARVAALGLFGGGENGLCEQLERELEAVVDPDAQLRVKASMLDALIHMRSETSTRAREIEAVARGAPEGSVLRLVADAHQAFLASELGSSPADECAARAAAALEGGALLQQSRVSTAYHLCLRVLSLSDRVSEAAAAIAALREEAHDRGSARLRAGAAWYAAELSLRTGQVKQAEMEARESLAAAGAEPNTFSGGAVEILVSALAERGEFAEARELLRRHDFDAGPWVATILLARARLSLAEGSFEHAYAEARRSGVLRERQGKLNPTWNPWRGVAALALAHLDHRAEAVKLADAELRLATRYGAPLAILRAMHARVVAEADTATRVELCRMALASLADRPAMLESIRLRLELGAGLAYLGHRVEAREALRPALADADAIGATPLARRARRELVATGLRPRRSALAGAKALTPRQRQICELAARGKPNRAIAAELFLSIKTVETHLAAGFRKLGVSSRSQLAAELAA